MAAQCKLFHRRRRGTARRADLAKSADAGGWRASKGALDR
jgi:hypothetical protein